MWEPSLFWSVPGECDRSAMGQKEEESEVAEWKIEQISGKWKKWVGKGRGRLGEQGYSQKQRYFHLRFQF